MIDAIVGHKGTGKTARLLREIVIASEKEESNIVCLQYGKRFDRQIPYQVRLLDVTDFPVKGYGELLAFIAGINSKDYDITHIYMDSAYKLAGDHSQDNLAKFIHRLDDFAAQFNVRVTITISEDPENLHQDIRSYLREH